jgi:hypothetical protein
MFHWQNYIGSFFILENFEKNFLGKVAANDVAIGIKFVDGSRSLKGLSCSLPSLLGKNGPSHFADIEFLGSGQFNTFGMIPIIERTLHLRHRK